MNASTGSEMPSLTTNHAENITAERKADKKANKAHKSHKSDGKKHKKDKKQKKDKKENKKEKHGKVKSAKLDISLPGSNSSGDQKITIDDYFLKNQEYRIWLKQVTGRNFEDLSSKDTRKIFEEEFIPAYNNHSLPSSYYTGTILQSTSSKDILHTKHNWGLRLNAQESIKLQDLAEDIVHLTNTTAPTAATTGRPSSTSTSTAHVSR